MQGIRDALRQFLRLAKPWERVVAGVVLAVVGALLGIYIVSAIGVVLVILVVAAWFRSRRGGGPAVTEDTVVPADPGVSEEVTGD